MENDRDCADLHICFVHEVEGIKEGYLSGGGIVDTPQLGEVMAVRIK